MDQDAQAKAAHYRNYAVAFQDQSVVDAYRYRPEYPAETFEILVRLMTREPRYVLDVGCGRGDIARQLVGQVERIDAIDFSLPMIEQGKLLPDGDHPHLRWFYGRIEEIPLQGPYALITAGDCMHWMDWRVVMPRFAEILMEGAYLAIIGRKTTPDPWSLLGPILSRYRTDSYLAQLRSAQDQSFFQQLGEATTTPVPFVQSIDEAIEAYHSRSGFSRERMGTERAAAFDQEARELLTSSYSSGFITYQLTAQVIWGLPKALA